MASFVDQFTQGLLFDPNTDDMFSPEFSEDKVLAEMARQQEPFAIQPITPQQAQQAVAPMTSPPGVPQGMAQRPVLPPAPPSMSSPGGADFLNSPGLAMAAQAMNNISALRRDRIPQTTPVQAYQQAINRQALLKQRDRMQDLQERQANDTAALRRQANAINLYKAGLPSESEKKLNNYMLSLGLDPSDPASIRDPRVSEFLSKSGININMGAETAGRWQEALDERNIGAWTGILDRAEAADTSIDRFNTLSLLNQSMPRGGTLGEGWTDVSRNLQGLGINIPGLDADTTPYELFKAIATENQFNRTQVLKGAISEKEIGLAGLMDASLANSQQGRELIIEYRIAEARRHQQIADAAENWMERTGADYFDQRAFRKSDEFASVRSTAFGSPRMLELAVRVKPELREQYKKTKDGTWYFIQGDEATPIFGAQ